MLGFGRASANISTTLGDRIDVLLKAKKLKRQEEKLVVL
jgi:hypothetical protein